MRRINPFDWKREFPEIMKAGGFDAVIGNPPYGYMILTAEQEYFATHYHHQDYQKDLYLLFLERYADFFRVDGLLGVIVSNTWLQSVTLRKIRQYLTTHYRWLRVLSLSEKVFRAIVDTHVLIFQRADTSRSKNGAVIIDLRHDGVIGPGHSIPLEMIPRDGEPINIVAPLESQKLCSNIRNKSLPLLRFCSVYNGIKPFEKGKGTPPQTEKILKERPYVREGAAPATNWSPLLRGSLINRYKIVWNHDYWVRYGPWLAAPRDPAIFEAPLKIMVRQTGDSIIAALVEQGFIARNNLHILLPRDPMHDLRYILGILNSRLIDFIYTVMNPEKGEALAEVKKHHVEQLPIRVISGSSPSDRTLHDKLVSLVDHMLELHQRWRAAGASNDKTRLQRQIDATDREIDRLVYDLYRLTEEEIAIVEGAVVASDR